MVRLCLPEFGPGDLPASYVLLLCPGPLLAHAHHSAEALLFHLSTNLVLDNFSPLLSSGSAAAWFQVATQLSPTCSHGSHQGTVPQFRLCPLHCLLSMPLPSCSDLLSFFSNFSISGISVEQDFSGPENLELLCLTAEGKLGVVAKKSNVA